MVCALFPDKPRAAAAIDALVNGNVSDELVGVVMHEGSVTHEDLGSGGARSGRRTLQGAVIGAVAGGVLGGVVALVFAPGGMLLSALFAAIFVGAGVGAAYTGLAGAISGRDTEQPQLEHLAGDFEEGKVLVTLEIRGGADAREQAKDILARFGGRPITAS